MCNLCNTYGMFTQEVRLSSAGKILRDTKGNNEKQNFRVETNEKLGRSLVQRHSKASIEICPISE